MRWTGDAKEVRRADSLEDNPAVQASFYTLPTSPPPHAREPKLQNFVKPRLQADAMNAEWVASHNPEIGVMGTCSSSGGVCLRFERTVAPYGALSLVRRVWPRGSNRR